MNSFGSSFALPLRLRGRNSGPILLATQPIVMQKMKTKLKAALLGKPGLRPRRIATGLLRGLFFNVDTSCKAMRLVGLDEREIASAMRRLVSGVRSALDI